MKPDLRNAAISLLPFKRLPRAHHLPVLLAACLMAIGAAAQSGTPADNSGAAAQQQSAANLPEISSHETNETFQVRVNLVDLRVVVRDKQGNAVGNLKQDDFVILDEKVPQMISRFSVEHAVTAANAQESGPESKAAPGEVTFLPSPHRTGYLFDDFNSSAQEVTNAKLAAEQAIHAMSGAEQLGIFTFSGQGQQDFTGDKEKLLAALRQLQPRPQGGPPTDCPPITYYIADAIVNSHDAKAEEMVRVQIIACQFDGHATAAADELVHEVANRKVQLGEAQFLLALQSLNTVVHRISEFPAPRTIVLLSPGFIVGREQASLTDSLDRAIRAGVFINTIDLRGVFTQSPTGTDISQKAYGTAYFSQEMNRYEAAGQLAQSDTMLQIANTTGGTNYRNRNDLEAGLAKLTAPPEYTYLLAFNPQNLKNDGKFHPLKIELKQGSGYTLQARKGYYAPKPGDASHEGQREIEEEVFARDEIHELPLQVQTQFFRSGEDAAHIYVLVHVDVRHMAFKKADGRNLNNLTVVAALFDHNANLISGKSNTVQMHIKDDTLAGKLNSGITVKSNFDVPPGSYMVRVVARDAQGKLTAQNSVVEIPPQ